MRERTSCHLQIASAMIAPETRSPPVRLPSPRVAVRALEDIPRGTVTDPYPEELRLGLGMSDSREWQSVIEVRVEGGLLVPDKGGPSQWLALIPGARDRHEQNVEAVRRGVGQIVYRTIRDIKGGDLLYAWYGEGLAREMEVPILTPANIRGNQEYTCDSCGQTFQFPNNLKAHMMFHCLERSRPGHMDRKLGPAGGLGGRPMCLPAHFHPAWLSSPFIRPMAGPSAFRPLHAHQNTPLTTWWLEQSIMAERRRQLAEKDITPLMTSPVGGLISPVPPPFTGLLFPQARNISPRGDGDHVLQPYQTNDSCSLTELSPDSDVKYGARLPVNNTKLPMHMYPLPIPSEKAGEPIDLLPRSLYTIKSRKGHLCIYCGKFYSRKYGLKIHLRTHTGYKPLKCKVCLRPFGDPSNLNKHIRLHAEGDTPYRCDHCGKVLVRRRDLERHIKSRHPNEATKISRDTNYKIDIDSDSKADTESDRNSDSDDLGECCDAEEIDVLS